MVMSDYLHNPATRDSFGGVKVHPIRRVRNVWGDLSRFYYANIESSAIDHVTSTMEQDGQRQIQQHPYTPK